MRKVLVIGSGGAGKSTFASRLASQIGVEVIHLDELYWKAGWVETSKADWAHTVDAIVERERWIMDGNYGGTLNRRLAACDTVVFLDLPRIVCIVRVLTRRLRFHNRSRPDMTLGCPERISWAFLAWIWAYPSQRKPEILSKIAEIRPDQCSVILKSQAEIEVFFSTLSQTMAPSAGSK